MDPMVRSRRNPASAGDHEATAARLEQDFQTALGQEERNIAAVGVPAVAHRGEASPGTLESGVRPDLDRGPSLPVAHPFHSGRVKEEVSLQRQRPLTLDEDQARVAASVGRASAENELKMESVEPDYARVFGSGGEAASMEHGPRVARVEAADITWAPHQGSSTGPMGLVSVGADAPTEQKVPEEGGTKTEPVALEGGLLGEEELLPDRSSPQNFEAILVQMMEENRALKRRLEQAELRSHSSWHSGVAGEGGAVVLEVSLEGRIWPPCLVGQSKMGSEAPFMPSNEERVPVRGLGPSVADLGGMERISSLTGWYCNSTSTWPSTGFTAGAAWDDCRIGGLNPSGKGDKGWWADKLVQSAKQGQEIAERQLCFDPVDDEDYAPSEPPEQAEPGLVPVDGLEVGKFPVSFWPLAALHATERNWHELSEYLGRSPGMGLIGKLGLLLEATLDWRRIHLEVTFFGPRREYLEFGELLDPGKVKLEEARKEWLEKVLIEGQAEHNGKEERIIVKPPGFLVELGILNANHRWWIRKALYGLPTSPRDWGRYRDGEFRKFKIEYEGGIYQLFQAKSDDALWLVRRVAADYQGEVAGILVVYVDDLAFFAEAGLAKQFIATVRTLWKTSDPEWLGESPVTFCGVELTKTPLGYRLAQGAYIRELLQRYNIQEDAGVPLVKWTEPEATGEATGDLIR
ncbi:GIP, partial [Symbiodinium sp. CCMP2456]